MVVFCEGSFSFKDLDGDGLLIVLVGCEDLGFLGWDVGSFGDDLAHNASHSFNTQGKGSSVDDNDVAAAFFSADNTSLNCSSVADSLVRVDTCVWFFAIEEFFDELPDFGDSG